LAEFRSVTGAALADGDRSSRVGGRYDGMTVVLHWITVAIVLFQFFAGELWNFFPKQPRHSLIQFHISMGLILFTVVFIRIFWRRTQGRALPPVGSAPVAAAARCMHYLLYLALVGMVVTGALNRWTAGQPLGFFSLVNIPSPMGDLGVWHHRDALLHSLGAWIFAAVVGLHASAALIHHYILRDGVFLRMMPSRYRSP
jgi:cytochrome b561